MSMLQINNPDAADTDTYVIDLQNINRSTFLMAGGKGANLGELSTLKGIQVPEGFCVTTAAYKTVIQNNPEFTRLLDELTHQTVEDKAELAGELRRLIEGIAIPQNIREEIIRYLHRFGEKTAFAVRSSATAEDLPTASFAGQQDTFLNCAGKDSVLKHISRCWASLFTDRAVIYRMQNGFGNRNIHLAVVVQKMIFPQAAGIMFTADPVTSNRKTVSIDAGFGLGEALVSGLVNADQYTIRNNSIIEKKIAVKKLAVYPVNGGGTAVQHIEPEKQNRQVLADDQIVQLGRIGRTIEAHFGSPQDIEWCLAAGTFYIVQSRPVTTLYPVPKADDRENHVYISVGHQQMMTDAMRPLGSSLWKLPAMVEAGGRLFVDVTPRLASPAGRHTIINVLGRFDPLVKDALTTLVEREGFIPTLPDDTNEHRHSSGNEQPGPVYEALIDYDPAVVGELIRHCETALEELKQQVQTRSGLALLDFIMDDIFRLRKRIADPKSMGVIMTAMNAAVWINEKMEEWLGEKAVADTLSQSVPNNITSQMGLDLLTIADVIRPYPEVIAYLSRMAGAQDHHFLDELPKYDGGRQALDAITAFLNSYGMRCAGEIDITRDRWSEKPATIVPMILTNLRNAGPGAGKQKFEQGLKEAQEKEQEIIRRLKDLPDGEQKVAETIRMTGLVRNLSGYREYPKYHMINCYFVYKQALLREADSLLQAGVIHSAQDIYFLTFQELKEAVHTQEVDYAIIRNRKKEYETYKKLTPPRVITSDGEIITGTYNKETLPDGALAGLAVSSGVTEGRARVILAIEDAVLQEGDILVTTFTDPSWTPLFLSIKGLVTEVGGLMTHGAVIAREYGLPAVVGVENATRRIKDGQQIRVHGTEGFVEILLKD